MPILAGIFIVAALIGGGVAIARHKSKRAEWVEVKPGALAPDSRVRVSLDRVTDAPAAIVEQTLDGLGYSGATAWTDDYPVDWPSDDRSAGRTRIEMTVPPKGANIDDPTLHVRAWQLETV